ncbi:MAG TPA: hypothetical protein VMU50_18055, partial [Polyangia bacterium]|nr:hypothetical protein [Polyangia bacterium]
MAIGARADDLGPEQRAGDQVERLVDLALADLAELRLLRPFVESGQIVQRDRQRRRRRVHV